MGIHWCCIESCLIHLIESRLDLGCVPQIQKVEQVNVHEIEVDKELVDVDVHLVQRSLLELRMILKSHRDAHIFNEFLLAIVNWPLVLHISDQLFIHNLFLMHFSQSLPDAHARKISPATYDHVFCTHFVQIYLRSVVERKVDVLDFLVSRFEQYFIQFVDALDPHIFASWLFCAYHHFVKTV